MVPTLGFMVLPSFLDQGRKTTTSARSTASPRASGTIASFTLDAAAGDVSRRTVFIRNNGTLGTQPSFTILSNHCVHLGCPVQPNGPTPKTRADGRTAT